MLMSDAAHASVADIEASVEFDKDFNVVGFKYGPHDQQFAAMPCMQPDFSLRI